MNSTFEQAALEVACQRRLMQRCQLAGNQPPEIRSALDVVHFRRTSIERLAPQRFRVLLESTDQSRQLSEPLVLGQMASQLQSFAGREPSGLPEFQTEIMRVERGLIDLLCHRSGSQLQAL